MAERGGVLPLRWRSAGVLPLRWSAEELPLRWSAEVLATTTMAERGGATTTMSERGDATTTMAERGGCYHCDGARRRDHYDGARRCIDCKDDEANSKRIRRRLWAVRRVR